MANMHLLGHIRARVIDHDRCAACEAFDPQPLISPNGFKHPGEGIGLQCQIDEPGTRNCRLLAQVVNVQTGSDRLGYITRFLTDLLGQTHRHIGLVIAELRISRGSDQRIGPGMRRPED